jgi:nucleotide-binding universal stress UspA family protein
MPCDRTTQQTLSGPWGFGELLLGSVSQATVLHAVCPVVVGPIAS